MRVQRDGRQVTVTVAADGDENTVSHAGAALLAETADRLGLTAALSAGLGGLRQRRGGHDPGRVVRDLAVMLADGGDALCDLRALRDQPALFGSVASDSTAWRVIDDIAEAGLLDAVRAARATTRARAFDLGVRPAGAAGHRHRRDAGHRALRQGRDGRHLQGWVRLSPAAGLPRLPRPGRRRDAARRAAAARATRAPTTPATTSGGSPTRSSRSRARSSKPRRSSCAPTRPG